MLNLRRIINTNTNVSYGEKSFIILDETGRGETAKEATSARLPR